MCDYCPVMHAISLSAQPSAGRFSQFVMQVPIGTNALFASDSEIPNSAGPYALTMQDVVKLLCSNNPSCLVWFGPKGLWIAISTIDPR